MADKKMTYSQAVEELDNIITEIEDASIGVDQLTEKVKRATFLIAYCKKMLTATEKEVNELFVEMNETQDAPAGADE